MKKSLVVTVLLILINFSIYAQRTATWKGGQAGRSSDWNCATNWKEGRVPDEFSNVHRIANVAKRSVEPPKDGNNFKNIFRQA